MLNQSGVKKETAGAPTQILYSVKNQMSVSIIVRADVSSAVEENGRKVVKAGTPLTGNLEDRGTEFFEARSTEQAVGVLLHDVDITSSSANGTLLVWGFVNLDRLDDATQALIDESVKESLSSKIWFLRD